MADRGRGEAAGAWWHGVCVASPMGRGNAGQDVVGHGQDRAGACAGEHARAQASPATRPVIAASTRTVWEERCSGERERGMVNFGQWF